MEGGIMRCDECGKSMGPKSKLYPLILDNDLFSFCKACVHKFDWLFEKTNEGK
jgi:hypothetical protein